MEKSQYPVPFLLPVGLLTFVNRFNKLCHASTVIVCHHPIVCCRPSPCGDTADEPSPCHTVGKYLKCRRAVILPHGGKKGRIFAILPLKHFEPESTIQPAKYGILNKRLQLPEDQSGNKMELTGQILTLLYPAAYLTTVCYTMD